MATHADTHMDAEQLRKTIDSIRDLPTLPTIASTVSRLAAKDESTASDIADIIAHDQTLTAKILKIANSAFYGLPNEVRTLRAAIVLLGFSSIRNIVLATSIFDAFYTGGDDGRFSRANLWVHSVAVGATCKVIAALKDLGLPEEMFIAGLMHDLGKVVLDRFAPEDFRTILRLSQQEKLLPCEAETRVLGVTHADVGRWLCERWQLPAYIIQSMGYHHTPEDCPDMPEWAAVVHVADILARTMKVAGGEDMVPRLSQAAWDLLGLQTDDVRGIAQQTQVELQNASAFLALVQ